MRDARGKCAPKPFACRGLIRRSIYRASNLRRTKFSARIALDERKNKTPSFKPSEGIPTIARDQCNRRASCPIRRPPVAAQ